MQAGEPETSGKTLQSGNIVLSIYIIYIRFRHYCITLVCDEQVGVHAKNRGSRKSEKEQAFVKYKRKWLKHYYYLFSYRLVVC